MVAILGAVFLPLLLTVYLSFNIHMAIVPIMGRNGTLDNPEIAVAIMSGILAIACTSFVVSISLSLWTSAVKNVVLKHGTQQKRHLQCPKTSCDNTEAGSNPSQGEKREE